MKVKQNVLGIIGLAKGLVDSVGSIIKQRNLKKISSRRVGGLSVLGLAVAQIEVNGLSWPGVVLTGIGACMLIFSNVKEGEGTP